jgi:hypothetical protein
MKQLILLFTLIIASSNVAFSQFSATFIVTDDITGAPIENAQITFDGNFFESTDATGQAVFTNFANGTYSYNVSAPCYDFISDEITITDADYTQAVEISASTTNSIVFFVGSPFTIEGTVVTVTGDDNYFQEITLGAFDPNTIENVPFGEYNYTIVAPCYEIVNGTVTVECNNGDGIGVFEEPALLTTNSVFFFVGSPLSISGATVTVSGDDFFQELTTGAPFGDVMDNVPYGDYSYTITAPCYESLSGNFTVDCANGEGVAVFAEPVQATSNSVFFFVGSPLSISGATVTVSGDDFFQELTTGAPFGDVMDNVPYGDYSYTITAPCYESLSGNFTVDCANGEGVAVFAEPVQATSNSVFFFVGSPLSISGATVTVSGDDFFQELTTGAPFGDVMDNVPYGDYSYSISAPCYEPLSGNFTVDCANGEGVAVFAEPVQATSNSVFFFVGSPLSINGAVVSVTGDGFDQELVTGAPFGDVMDNVPYGDYTYTITADCYETVTGTMTVDCANGEGVAVFEEPVAIVIDNSTTHVAATITANEIGFGFTYQWLDCNNGNAEIEGATDVSFTASQNGSYAVAITNQSCTVTSECVEITSLGISTIEQQLIAKAFPNPFSDQLKITISELNSNSLVEIYNITGQLVSSHTFNNQSTIYLNLSDLSKGSYILKITSNNKQHIQQLIKQ